MATSPPTSNEPRTEEEFNQQLGDLIAGAHHNGVDVEGGWAHRGGAEDPNWGVEIYRVAQSSQPPDGG